MHLHSKAVEWDRFSIMKNKSGQSKRKIEPAISVESGAVETVVVAGSSVASINGLEPKPLSPSFFWILFLLSVLNVWPLFWFQYLPFMDHPSHMLKANVLAHYGSSVFNYSQFYAFNTLPVPNLLSDYLTAFFAKLYSIDVASRLAVGLTMVSLPLSVWFYVSKTRPQSALWALLAIPLAWSRFLFFGNENFSLAVPILFFLLGSLVSWEPRFSPRHTVALLVLVTLIYFAHFLVFAVAGLALTIHFFIGKLNLRRAVMHAIPLLPGSVFAGVWFASKSGGGLPSQWSFDLIEKLTVLAQGVSSEPWGVIFQSPAFQAFCVSVVLFLFVQAYRSFSYPTLRLSSLLFVFCCGIAFCLQRWTIIFIPDQRMWWMAMFIGFVFLPVISEKALIYFAIFFFPLAIGTSLTAGRMFTNANAHLAFVESQFASFPAGLRLMYFGDPNLPPHLHRAFEYYHIRKGGRNTMQFIGKDHPVVYKPNVFLTPPGYGYTIYDYNANPWIPYFKEFDGAVIIGDPTPAQKEVVDTLTSEGFRVANSGVVSLLLSPDYKGL